MGSDVAINIGSDFLSSGKSSFDFSFSFLPKVQREALRTIYAFCRTSDDLVDNASDPALNLQRLRTWRRELEQAIVGTSKFPVLNNVIAVADRFNIPVEHFHDLLRGVEMDLTKKRYENFEELKTYCYLVASTVGLISLEIFRPRSEATKEYAVNLGIALQLTNILRDVAVDARYGRVYLPQEDLRRFGCAEEDILAGRYTPAFRSLMEFEASRAEEYYTLARASLPGVDRRATFAAKIMERIYYHTLLRIRAVDYDVFTHAVRLSRGVQFLIAVKYWIKQRLFGL